VEKLEFTYRIFAAAAAVDADERSPFLQTCIRHAFGGPTSRSAARAAGGGASASSSAASPGAMALLPEVGRVRLPFDEEPGMMTRIQVRYHVQANGRPRETSSSRALLCARCAPWHRRDLPRRQRHNP
jgi:hypothetical protein